MSALIQRVASRGFPSVADTGDLTGTAALASQGGTSDPAHGITNLTGSTTQTLTGFEPEGPAPTDGGVVLEGVWGLPGDMTNPDQTPRTHAAPVPGWAGSYHDTEAIAVINENAQMIHGEYFGAPMRQEAPPVGGTNLPMNPWSANTPGENVLEPLTGQIRAMGHGDITQGYSRSNGYGFDAGHKYRADIGGNVINAYLDPAERPFIVPQASGTFTPNDAVQGPGPFYSQFAGDAINTDPPSPYAAPYAPDTLATPLQGAPANAGWRS